MILCTTDEVPGRVILESIGLVRGNTVRSRHLGRDISASFKRLVGGEIEEYTKLLAESREQAIDRMVAEARARGADAIVCLRFTTSEITNGAAEFVAYGTAVRLGK
ncbi:MAG: heavy metal-binding domain-containing protein [Planctomycetota bacterium]